MSFLNKLRPNQPQAHYDEAIFDGSNRNSGLPNMRHLVFNPPTTNLQPSEPSPESDTAHGMFYLPDEDDENCQEVCHKQTSAAPNVLGKRDLASSEVLVPLIREIRKLKLTLLKIQAASQPKDELLLGIRQNLLRCMMRCFDAAKTVELTATDEQTIAEIKDDFENVFYEQELLLLDLKHNKLNELLELKSDKANKKNSAQKQRMSNKQNKKKHFQQPKLMRQMSRSAESGLDAVGLGVRVKPKNKPVILPVSKLKRSETARTDRTLYFSQLARKTSNVLRRNKSLNSQKRRKSFESVSDSVSNIHLGRTSQMMGQSNKKNTQPFLKLNNSGQLVFDSTDVDQAKLKRSPLIVDNPPTQQTGIYKQVHDCTVSKSTSAKAKETTATKSNIGQIKSRNAENAMPSSHEDSVKVENLVNFTHNKKPEKIRLVRGNNSVNSKSFRESKKKDASNTHMHLHHTKSDQIKNVKSAPTSKMQSTSYSKEYGRDIDNKIPLNNNSLFNYVPTQNTSSAVQSTVFGVQSDPAPTSGSDKRSMRLNRKFSQSLTDLLEPSLNSQPSNPSSCFQDYGQSEQRHIGNGIEYQTNENDLRRNVTDSRRNVTDTRCNKVDQHYLDTKNPSAQFKQRISAIDAESSDSVFEDSSDYSAPPPQRQSRMLRRSVSDDVICGQEETRLREDLRRLADLQAELKETQSQADYMSRDLDEQMLHRCDVKPKRITLPRAMLPNFGHKKKCVVM